jgi:hypothetical protein
MKHIGLETVVVRKTGQITADMDGEIVMMSLDTSRYYNLGKTGSAIWGMIEAPAPVERIVSALTEQYQVSRDQCEAEVIAFLEDLVREGLIDTP